MRFTDEERQTGLAGIARCRTLLPERAIPSRRMETQHEMCRRLVTGLMANGALPFRLNTDEIVSELVDQLALYGYEITSAVTTNRPSNEFIKGEESTEP